MYAVQVQWIGQGQALTLMFASSDSADAAYAALTCVSTVPTAEIVDDYGTRVLLLLADVRCVVIQDLARVHAGNEDAQILAAHANASLQRRAAVDPKLRQSIAPAQPMMPNGGFRA